MRLPLSLALFVSTAALSAPQEKSATASQFIVTPLPLPGSAPVSMDYLAYDSAHQALFVPGGNHGQVYVLNTKTGEFRTIDGFATAERRYGERKATVGPSSATVGDNTVYVGNRADSKICAIDSNTLKLGSCVTLPASPDGLQYIATTHEVWATTPSEKSIQQISTSGGKLGVVSNITLEGEPEGYAFDADRGIFYTNYEDRDETVAIDVKSHKLLSTWKTQCGEKGPRGLIFDAKHRYLLVGCSDGAVVLNVGKNGEILGRLKTGAGVDNIDYSPATATLFIPSGKLGNVTVATVDANGGLTKKEEVSTSDGVRCVVVDGAGKAYGADSKGGRLLVIRSK